MYLSDPFINIIYFELKEIGAAIVNNPKLYPEYGPDYYALFFKDLEGIKYEIVCNEQDEAKPTV